MKYVLSVYRLILIFNGLVEDTASIALARRADTIDPSLSQLLMQTLGQNPNPVGGKRVSSCIVFHLFSRIPRIFCMIKPFFH